MNVKAFDIVPLIENIHTSAERTNSKIHCIECCGSELFIGTDDSFIIKYHIDEVPSSTGKVHYNCGWVVQRPIDLKKPIRILKAASALGKLIVLCDTTLMVLTTDSLEPVGQRRKNTTTFCVNEDSRITDPFCIQICVAHTGKKQIFVYNVTLEEKLISVATISGLPEPPRLLVADNGSVCAALDTQYVMVNLHTGSVQELFSYGSEDFNALACRVAKEEFLVSGPGGLAIFVTSSGTTNRPPFQWSYPLEGLTYHHPYILGLSHDVIMVHSVLDQQQKQALPLVGGLTIGNYDGRLYVSRNTSIVNLCPVPWEIQVKVLLADGRVEEALSLTEKAGRARDWQTELTRRFVQNQAAFIYFSRLEMEKAQELFMEGQVDERELISIFPGLLPASSGFVRAEPPLHNIADVVQLFSGDQDKIAAAKHFLLHFLQMAFQSNGAQHPHEVDTALVKLLADMDLHSELVALLQGRRLNCDMKDCAAWLEQKGCYYALGLLHRRNGAAERLLRVWSRIVLGEVADLNFPGLDTFADALAEVSDADLVWKYADLVLQRDEEAGSKVFSSAALDQNTVLEHLQQYPRALVAYLENLVLVKNVQEEKYHTRLGVQYLDRIIQLRNAGSSEEETEAARSALRSFLETSTLYRAQFLLPQVRDANLLPETAIMYGKIGDHEKALNILAYQLKDYSSAEAYCLRNGTSTDGPNKLLHILLNTYLNPNLGELEQDEFLVPTLELLSKHAGKLDPVHVLEIIPSHWSLGILDTFLRATLRKSLHKHRLSMVESALAKSDSLQQESLLFLLRKHSVKLLEHNYCCVCKKPFSDGTFARYPNDILTHVQCAKLKNVCPVTGHLFTSLSAGTPDR